MAKFTVIGIYEDSNQTFAHHVEAATAQEAFVQVEAMDDGPWATCIVAIPGHLSDAAGELFFPE